MTGQLNILGIRGVPAAHGGFETFVHDLAPYLVGLGWKVIVYCQHERGDPDAPADGSEDDWNGVRRVHLHAPGHGALSTVIFDLRCVLDVLKRPGIDMVMGYNTAVFSILQRLAGRKVLIYFRRQYLRDCKCRYR
jgi:hypothetical protein